MKRWIIRGFFIGFCFAFVVAWFVSYPYQFWGGYGGCGVNLKEGTVTAAQADSQFPSGWYWYVERGTRGMSDSEFFRYHHFAGVSWGKFTDTAGRKVTFCTVPLWFPTAISAALLWLVWRKTRPKAKGGAFPVEAQHGAAPEGKQA